MQALLAQEIPGGYSWTLTSRLGQMLRIAEEAFGPRDKTYTILGIEFEANGPQIWYPGNCKNIAIQLRPETANDQIMGSYQLAHECIHLLSPQGRRAANVLEEGLATYFACDYIKNNFGFEMPIGMQCYQKAKQQITQLLEIDAGAIKNLRAHEFILSQITTKLIIELYPSLSAETAEALGAPFNRDFD